MSERKNECARCGASLVGLQHPHHCPGPKPHYWESGDIDWFND